MNSEMIYIDLENLEREHLCCAIADKKHQSGVEEKKTWLKQRIKEGHIFRKLNQKGKVFIEYAPLEKAWVPVLGDNYMYIYCLWVSGSFKGKGYGRELLQFAIDDAKQKGYSGICTLSSKKKKPFLSDKKFFMKFGFKAVDSIGDEYELLALVWGDAKPCFAPTAKAQRIESNDLTVYYSYQCPYIPNCIEQIQGFCNENGISLELVKVDSLEKAKSVPCVFNNWAVFYNGRFETVHLLNEGYLKKMLAL